MSVNDWLSNNYIEIFGAVTGIIYVLLEIRQNIWLWPVGIITSAVYIWVFFSGKLYADMSLQGYYLIISFMGWFWWKRSSGQGGVPLTPENVPSDKILSVVRVSFRTGIILGAVFVILFTAMYLVLDRLTDSPVPAWDSFITSLSVIATWMLARKIYEHWYLWIIINISAAALFFTRGLHPTVVLYIVYCVMSFAGLKAWRKSL